MNVHVQQASYGFQQQILNRIIGQVNVYNVLIFRIVNAAYPSHVL
jgi:hypothetical protein